MTTYRDRVTEGARTDQAEPPEPWNLRSFHRDVRWLAELALEALDAIDRLEGKLAWHEDQMAQVPEEAWNLHGSSDPDA